MLTLVKLQYDKEVRVGAQEMRLEPGVPLHTHTHTHTPACLHKCHRQARPGGPAAQMQTPTDQKEGVWVSSQMPLKSLKAEI